MHESWMDGRCRRALRGWLAVPVVLLLGGCAPRLSVPAARAMLDPLFAPPTPAERSAVEAEWAARRIEPVEVRVEWERRESDGLRTLVLSHLVEGDRHFGLVRIPPHRPDSRLPVLMVLHGGNRGASRYHFFRDGRLAREWVQVVPSFRSEWLFVSPFRIYRSDGLSNPWDGDVEDSMALVGAVLSLFPQTDSTRVAAFGHSRGGAVALLMGIRDRRIGAVVSAAAPTDLFLPDIQRLAERGLRISLPRLPGANFLADSVLFALRDGRIPVERARLELLRRSPAWFAHRLPPTQLHHGALDDKVPFAHGERMGRARERGARMQFHGYASGRHRTRTLHGAMPRAEAFLSQLADSTFAAP